MLTPDVPTSKKSPFVNTRGSSPTDPPENQGLTPGAVTDAVVALMRAANPGAEPDTALAATIAGGIQPMLVSELASGRATTGQELLTGPGFSTIVTQYLGSPQTGYLSDDTRKAMLAQLQRANVTSSDSAALSAALGNFGSALRGQQGSDGNADSSGKRFDTLSLASIQTEIEYRRAPATVELVQAGVSFQTFLTLRADGFSPSQMTSAAKFATGLGLDANRIVVPVAHIQRARPEDANAAMRDTSANWKSVVGLERELADARARGASREEIERIEKRAQEMRDYSRDYDKGYTGKVEKSKPGEGRYYDEFSSEVQRMAKDGVGPATATNQIEGELRRNQTLSVAERRTRETDLAKQHRLSDEEKIKKMKGTVATAAIPTRPSSEQPSTQAAPKTVKLDLG